MYRRINVTLPESTLDLLERLAEKGERSRLIDDAVRQYAKGLAKKTLKKRIREGALRRAERDRSLAQEWLMLEEGRSSSLVSIPR